MVIDRMDAFQFLPYTINILNRIWKKIKLKKLKDALVTRGQPFFDDLEAAILTFFRDYSNAVNDYVLYSYILEPQNPQKEAELIVQKLRKDYENLLDATKNLIRFFVAHKEELKEILDPEDWLLMEEIMVAFEEETPDWDFLYKVAKNTPLTQSEKQIQFERALNKLLEEFNRETGADKLMKRIQEEYKKK